MFMLYCGNIDIDDDGVLPQTPVGALACAP